MTDVVFIIFHGSGRRLPIPLPRSPLPPCLPLLQEEDVPRSSGSLL